jgi:RND family efflux transporter MFP subunit
MQYVFRWTLISAAALTLGCSGSQDQAQTISDAPPKPVTVATVQTEGSGSFDEVMGSVVARNTADISTKTQARVDRIPVDIGSRVRKGDLLAELDARDMQAHVQQARAVNDQTSSELKRFEQLLSQRVVSQQEFDGIKARATVAEASLHEAEAMLTYAHITAPFAGVVTRKQIDIGDMVFPGQPLFTLEESGATRFEATIAESHRNRIAVADVVKISIPDLDTVISGKVDDISPSADPMSRTFAVKIGLPTQVAIRPGQFGKLLLATGGEETTLFVPRSALVRRGQLDLVYVVSADNRAMLRLVRIGRQFPDKLEILSGLRENEQVVISDQRDLLDGDLVEVQS